MTPIDPTQRARAAQAATAELVAETRELEPSVAPAPSPGSGRSPDEMLEDARAILGCALTALDRVASLFLGERHPDVVRDLTADLSGGVAEVLVPVDGVRVLGVSAVRLGAIVAKMLRRKLDAPPKPKAEPAPGVPTVI
jgi:hypothetical protein